MKILIIANNDIGLIKFRKELLEELVKQYKVYVSIPDGEFVEAVKAIGCQAVICRHLERRGINPVKEIRLWIYYCRLVNKLRPGIVFTYTIKPNVYGGLACRKFKIPYVANITGLGSAVEQKRALRGIVLLLYKMGLAGAQKVFFQNTENRDLFVKRKIVNTAYDLIPGSGVNLGLYPMRKLPHCGDGKHGNPVKFAFISRIMKEKGIDQYLAAALIMQKQYPATEFHICGFCEDEYEGLLHELEKKGIVKFHGMIWDVSGFMNTIHCIVQPSYHEGMCNTLLEAASTGRPVLASDIPGCREAFDEGISGIGFKPQDIKSLVTAIESFIHLSYEKKVQMGQAGRKKMEREFDRRIVVEKYMIEVDKVTKE